MLPERWPAFWQDRQNRLLFSLRQSLKWGRGAYTERAEPKDDLFETPEEQALAADLVKRYGLEYLSATAGCARFLENLTVLGHLEALFGDSFPGSAGQPCRWLDVGAKNWSYVDALAAFAQKNAHEPKLVGLELDPYRRYADLHNRLEYAEAFTRPLSNVYYRAGDVLAERGQYHIITHFLPFVFIDPLLKWGLPERHFKPGAVLAQCAKLLKPGGLLLIVNQGEEEYQAQQALLAHEDHSRQPRSAPCPIRLTTTAIGVLAFVA